MSTVLRGNKLPRSEFVSVFVTACLTHGKRPPDKIAEATEEWLASWRALYAAEGVNLADTVDSMESVDSMDSVDTAETGPVVAAPKTGGSPRHLPLDVRVLVGRDAELASLDEVENVVLISGPAGVGKSALAIRRAHQLTGEFPDGQLYVDLRGAHGPLATTDALGVLLAGLGVPANACPGDQQRRIDLYRSLIADRRMLVVLDNAFDAAQVRPLLATGANCRTIVTSRNRMSGLVAREGARRVFLDVLNAEDAGTLLTSIIGAEYLDGAGAELAELAELCAYLPLALRLAAVKFADRPEQGFKNFVAALRGTDMLCSLALDDDDDSTIWSALDFSYRTLDPEARRFFRTLGLAEEPEFTPEKGAALAGVTVAEAVRLIGILASEHLVAAGCGNRFTMNRVLWAFARTMADRVSRRWRGEPHVLTAGHDRLRPRNRDQRLDGEDHPVADAALA